MDIGVGDHRYNLSEIGPWSKKYIVSNYAQPIHADNWLPSNYWQY